MKILYVTSSGCDNLEDGVLHGLRSLIGGDCIDYPKKDVMYKGFDARKPADMYGNLFTMWKTLDDITVDRTDIDDRIRANFFDWIVFGSIPKSLAWFNYYRDVLDPRKTILIDGNDGNEIFPFARTFLYFKRELQPKATYYYNYKLVPPFVYNRLKHYPNVMPIGFAIPKEKITHGITRNEKTKRFGSHIVDKELLANLKLDDGASGHVFSVESEYYNDFRISRFGVTAKRAGWDALRHYEIPANGAVLCFRDLNMKPSWNAPIGLNEDNCVIYDSAEALLRRLDGMTDAEYDRLLEHSYQWIDRQTTAVRATEILDLAKRHLQS